MSSAQADQPLFRAGGVSFLRIPAADPQWTASFYGEVFAWKIRDPAGNVAGVWQTGPRSGE